MRDAIAAGACIGTFIAGWAGATYVGRTATPIVEGTSNEVSSRGGDVGDQLARIEALIREVASRSTAAQPGGFQEPTREPLLSAERSELSRLAVQLNDMIQSMKSGVMSLDEVARVFPTPKEDVLQSLRDESVRDPEAPLERLIGMDYHDLVLAFGAPTRKRVVSMSSAGVATEWLWEMRNSASCFVAEFQNNVVRSCFFTARTYLDTH